LNRSMDRNSLAALPSLNGVNYADSVLENANLRCRTVPRAASMRRWTPSVAWAARPATASGTSPGCGARWAMRQGWGVRPVNEKHAQGILMAALGVLAMHYGYAKS
jgi:hypothetical protein